MTSVLSCEKKEAENKLLQNLIMENSGNSFCKYIKHRRKGDNEIDEIDGKILTDNSK